jgi:adenosine deaminase
MTDPEQFVRGLPKAELHLHLEGTLEPELFFTLAQRNGVPTGFDSVDALRAAYRFRDLQSFLDLYYRGTAVLRTREDFRDLTSAYLARARRDAVRHVEPFFDPQAHTARGVAFETVVGGIRDALEDGRRRYGITSRLVMCVLRHLGEAEALGLWAAAAPFRQWIAGVGLDSTERGNPPEKFARLFAEVRAAGLHVVAHAGEEGPPAYVWQALDLLGAERIDHGIRALEDPRLVERLVRERVPLTVCPLSNVALHVCPSLEAHPLRRLLAAGVRVTVGSDDPAYFGGYVADNYVAVQRALGLGRAEIETIARNGFEAAFVDASERERLLGELADYVATR